MWLFCRTDRGLCSPRLTAGRRSANPGSEPLQRAAGPQAASARTVGKAEGRGLTILHFHHHLLLLLSRRCGPTCSLCLVNLLEPLRAPCEALKSSDFELKPRRVVFKVNELRWRDVTEQLLVFIYHLKERERKQYGILNQS